MPISRSDHHQSSQRMKPPLAPGTSITQAHLLAILRNPNQWWAPRWKARVRRTGELSIQGPQMKHTQTYPLLRDSIMMVLFSKENWYHSPTKKESQTRNKKNTTKLHTSPWVCANIVTHGRPPTSIMKRTRRSCKRQQVCRSKASFYSRIQLRKWARINSSSIWTKDIWTTKMWKPWRPSITKIQMYRDVRNHRWLKESRRSKVRRRLRIISTPLWIKLIRKR